MAIAPSRQDLHVEGMLANFVVAQMQDLQANSIVQKLFPTVPVQFESDRYAFLPPAAWYQTEAISLAPLAETPGSDFTIDNTRRYLCKEYGEHVDLSERQLQNCDSWIDLGQMVGSYLAQKMLLKKEIQFNLTYLQPNTWQGWVDPTTKVVGDYDCTKAYAIGGQWDLATADIPKQVRLIRRQVLGATGQDLDVMVVSQSMMDVLATSYILRDYYKYVQGGPLPQQLIASALGLKRIEVQKTVINSAAKGQTAQMGFLSGDFFFLTYDSSGQGTLMKPTAGCTFEWTRYNATTGGPLSVKTIPLPKQAGYRYESRASWDLHLVNPQMGVFCGNPLSTASV